MSEFMLIPEGYSSEWHTFYAPSFELLWPDGMIGRVSFKRQPSALEKQKLIKNIDLASIKVKEYLEELNRAKEILGK